MSHTITPTLWNAEICADCGFRIDQHRVLYGTTDDEATDREVGGSDAGAH